MRVAKVAVVRRAQMNLVFVQRIFDLVGEHASRQAGDELLHMGLVRCLEDVIVDSNVVAQEGQLVLHILEEASDERGKMDNMRGLVFRKKCFSRCRIPGYTSISAVSHYKKA